MSSPTRTVEDRPGHIAAMVQNVSLAGDNRLCKEVEKLCGAGYHVSVISRHDSANEPWRHYPGLTLVEYKAPVDGDSTLTHLREYAVSLARQLPQLVRLHRRHPIDLLQICEPPDLYFPVAAVARRLGVRTLLDQRDLMPETLAQRYSSPPTRPMQVLYWLEKRTQTHFDMTVTTNEYMRDRLISAGGSLDRVGLVGNGPVLSRLDRGRDDPELPSAAELRRGFSRVVAWAGKMGRQDRVDGVVRVAERVVHEWGRRDVGFMLIGNGECLEELQALVVELGLQDHVWFPGWMSEVELYRHLASADVGLDASLQPEVTPVKGLEYLGVGLPMVAYDVLETHRLIDGAGVLVPPGDAEGLARALVSLLDDPKECERLGVVGRNRVQRALAWEHQGEVYLEVVAELLRTRPPRTGARIQRSRASATRARQEAP